MRKISMERTQVVAGKFTREEEQVIRDEAQGQDMTVSEYVRAVVFMSLIMDGNTKAMKLAAGLAASKMAEKFAALARDYFTQEKNAAALAAPEEHFRAVMSLSQPKIKSIDELGAYTGYFFTDEFVIDPKVREKVMGKGDPKARLTELIELAKTADFSSEAALTDALKKLAEGKGLGFGDYQAVARLAVTGTNVGPSITGIFHVLGRERTVARLEKFLATA